MNPFGWRGPDFLLFYVVAFGVAWGACLLGRRAILDSGHTFASWDRMTPFEWGFLCAGVQNAVRAVLASLEHKNQIRTMHGLLTLNEHAAAELDADERQVLRVLKNNRINHVVGLEQHLEANAAKIFQRLYASALVLSSQSRRMMQLLAVPPTLVFLLGVGKLFVGISRDKPVLFLVVLLLATGPVVVSLLRMNRTITNRARSAVEEKCIEMSPVAASRSYERLNAHEVAMMGALHHFIDQPSVYAQRLRHRDWELGPVAVLSPSRGDTSDSLSSCSSFSCGGDSSCGGGGGCGGGGCGGCGGGD